MILTARLTEKLTFQQLVVSATTFGGVIESWQDYKTVYGSINIQRGNTNFSDGSNYTDSISFYLRYIPISKKGFRLLYNGNTYSLSNITPIQRNKALVIDCTSVE